MYWTRAFIIKAFTEVIFKELFFFYKCSFKSFEGVAVSTKIRNNINFICETQNGHLRVKASCHLKNGKKVLYTAIVSSFVSTQWPQWEGIKIIVPDVKL